MFDPFFIFQRFNTASRGEFSQTRGIRTAAAVFKAISLELLRVLTEGSTHFVRCVRTDLTGTPEGFLPNVVRHQLRALSVADTARAKLIGYSSRIPFEQFLERYFSILMNNIPNNSVGIQKRLERFQVSPVAPKAYLLIFSYFLSSFYLIFLSSEISTYIKNICSSLSREQPQNILFITN